MSEPNRPQLTLKKPESDFYRITLGAGDVRYMRFALYFQPDLDVETIINEIRKAASCPVVKLEAVWAQNQWIAHVDQLFASAEWCERLRAHHSFFCSLDHYRVTSSVYLAFHHHLRLARSFAVDECAKAWVKVIPKDGDEFSDMVVWEESDTYPYQHRVTKKWQEWQSVFVHGPFEPPGGQRIDDDVARSFLDSPGHIVIPLAYRLPGDAGQYAIFQKTSFVESKLHASLHAELQERIAEDTNRLRRSQFITFVYLMEDKRNRRFKIGRSRTPGKREKTLQSEVPDITLRFSIPADESHERTLHERFRDRRVRGEWFELSADDVLEIVDYLKTQGDTDRATVDFNWLGDLFFRARRKMS